MNRLITKPYRYVYIPRGAGAGGGQGGKAPARTFYLKVQDMPIPQK